MRFRCCGRFAYWEIPLGPWRCTVCGRALAWGGPIPRAHEARFWEAIDEWAASVRQDGEDLELLKLFEQTIPRGHVLIGGGR
ncbi:MAG: hypothetical protein ACJ8GN_02005 [Longimicrobiaceae bacterium]